MLSLLKRVVLNNLRDYIKGWISRYNFLPQFYYTFLSDIRYLRHWWQWNFSVALFYWEVFISHGIISFLEAHSRLFLRAVFILYLGRSQLTNKLRGHFLFYRSWISSTWKTPWHSINICSRSKVLNQKKRSFSLYIFSHLCLF